jgi:hypothetical protein
MFVRNLNDMSVVIKLLEAEGEKVSAKLSPANTFVFTDGKQVYGFFSLSFEEIPVLRHFVIKKEFRSIKRAREAIKLFRSFMRNINPVCWIVVKKTYLKKMVQYYFKKEPYTVKEGCTWFLVEV